MHSGLLLQRAKLYATSFDSLDKAQEDFLRLAEKYRKPYVCNIWLADIAHSNYRRYREVLGDLSLFFFINALEYLDSAMDNNPGDVSIAYIMHNLLSDIVSDTLLINKGVYSPAEIKDAYDVLLQYYVDATKTYPADAGLYYRIAHILYDMDESVLAQIFAEKALELAGENISYCDFSRDLIYDIQGDSVDFYQISEIYNDAGFLNLKLGNFDDTIAAFYQSLLYLAYIDSSVDVKDRRMERIHSISDAIEVHYSTSKAIEIWESFRGQEDFAILLDLIDPEIERLQRKKK